MFPFDPPENIRKRKVSGGSKGNVGRKGSPAVVKLFSH